MTWELKDYQKKAVKELFDEFRIMLKSSERDICVFKAPTVLERRWLWQIC